MVAQRVQLFQISDFSGGLNFRDDAFTLRPNELADALNIRILPQGGFERRKTKQIVAPAADSTVDVLTFQNLWAFYGNGVEQVLMQQGNDAVFWAGGTTLTAINPDGLTLTGLMRAATMSRVSTTNSDRCYIQRNAEQVAWKWDGTTATVLADAHGAYNDNLASPSGGHLPKAKYIKAHNGFLFHANTVEAGVSKPFRLRWSFPGEPEDYRTNDWTDVGADDGDPITGIASLGHALVIFKNRSVWTLTGFDPNTFQLVKILDSAGCVGQEAVAVFDGGVYWFDATNGVYEMTSKGAIRWLWAKIAPKLSDDTIPSAFRQNITMGWCDSRLFCAVPWEASVDNRRVFVHDPLVGKGDAWYVYDYGGTPQGSVTGNDTPAAGQKLGGAIGPIIEWHPKNGAFRCFTISSITENVIGQSGSYLAELEADDSIGDDTILEVGSPLTYALLGPTPIVSYARTAWFAAGLPGVRKRWRRPTFVLDADHATTVGVQVFANYVNATPTRTQTLTVTPAETGTTPIWGTHNWGDGSMWGPAAHGEQALVRGQSFGNTYAVQLLLAASTFDDTTQITSAPMWGLNSFDMRYIPQRIR